MKREQVKKERWGRMERGIKGKRGRSNNCREPRERRRKTGSRVQTEVTIQQECLYIAKSVSVTEVIRFIRK